jgi:acetylornithine/succinyldiaminopimelate/putrescine aminotransferase
VWASAEADVMCDTHGERYLDLACGFGVHLHGHALNTPAQVGAPGLGDLYTHASRERACEALCTAAAQTWNGSSADDLRALILQTGSEAVEPALKTALLATGRSQIVAFEGAYHGTFGLALAATHSPAFREPFAQQYGSTVSFHPYGQVPALDDRVACVIVEPIQGRAGIILPPENFLSDLRAACDAVGALLIVDAVMVGAGRTSEHLLDGSCAPDIVCLGKALGGGMPASAVIARSQHAACWDRGGEVIHTSTFVGHPLTCAAILRTVEHLLPAAPLGERAAMWADTLAGTHGARGTGLAWAIDTGITGRGFALSQTLLHKHKIIVVPSGTDGSSITLLPSVVTDAERAKRAVAAIATALAES